MSLVPKRRFYNESMHQNMRSIITSVDDANVSLDEMGWEGRRVMGFRLPEWQRPAVWTQAQEVKFIRNIYKGVNIGEYMVNITIDPLYDRILLDGQQRLRTLERYVAGDIAVQGEKEHPDDDEPPALTWLELPDEVRGNFYRMGFSSFVTNYTDEAVLRAAYDDLNFSGTPHEPEQRAGGGDFDAARPGFQGF